MTDNQAYKEAVRRWGKEKAAVGRTKTGEHRVGKVTLGFFAIAGRGRSWEEAFVAADQAPTVT